MDINPKEALRRLRGLRKDHPSPSYRDVASNLMGQFIPDSGEYADAIIELLEDVYPDNWDDESLGEWGLIRLPKDKDGECIHVGDAVWDVYGNGGTVSEVRINGDSSRNTISVLHCENNEFEAYFPMKLTHHPPVTVESVLKEFADSMFDIREDYLMSDMSESEFHKKMQELRDSYATKLRLADESD